MAHPGDPGNDVAVPGDTFRPGASGAGSDQAPGDGPVRPLLPLRAVSGQAARAGGLTLLHLRRSSVRIPERDRPACGAGAGRLRRGEQFSGIQGNQGQRPAVPGGLPGAVPRPRGPHPDDRRGSVRVHHRQQGHPRADTHLPGQPAGPARAGLAGCRGGPVRPGGQGTDGERPAGRHHGDPVRTARDGQDGVRVAAGARLGEGLIPGGQREARRLVLWRETPEPAGLLPSRPIRPGHLQPRPHHLHRRSGRAARQAGGRGEGIRQGGEHLGKRHPGGTEHLLGHPVRRHELHHHHRPGDVPPLPDEDRVPRPGARRAGEDMAGQAPVDHGRGRRDARNPFSPFRRHHRQRGGPVPPGENHRRDVAHSGPSPEALYRTGREGEGQPHRIPLMARKTTSSGLTELKPDKLGLKNRTASPSGGVCPDSSVSSVYV